MNLAGIMQVFQGGVKIGRLHGTLNGPLTALAGGGQTGATLLGGVVNTIGTVVTAADSVQLPRLSEGRILVIFNQGANSADMYVNQNDSGVTIYNGGDGVSLLALPAGDCMIVVATSATEWSALQLTIET